MNRTGAPADTPTRKPYSAPRLVCYGHVKDIVQGGGGNKMDPSSGRGTRAQCWVAEALYGIEDPRTTLLRSWVSRTYVQKGRWWLFAVLYTRFGRSAANLIHRGYVPRRWVRPLFDYLLNHAFEESARAIKAARR